MQLIFSWKFFWTKYKNDNLIFSLEFWFQFNAFSFTAPPYLMGSGLLTLYPAETLFSHEMFGGLPGRRTRMGEWFLGAAVSYPHLFTLFHFICGQYSIVTSVFLSTKRFTQSIISFITVLKGRLVKMCFSKKMKICYSEAEIWKKL